MNIKICGMRDPVNIEAIANLPIQYMGFIFYEKSPRYVPNTLGILFSKLKKLKRIKKVGVFVNADIDFIQEKTTLFQLNTLQLHGAETPDFIHKIKQKWTNLDVWKAFGVDENIDFSVLKDYESVVNCFLLDTKSPQHGGTGKPFDWKLLEKYDSKMPFWLSGGIDENMANVLKQFKNPYFYGIDINSRFELAPALKDVEKIKIFINELRS